jgi:hypothetical protein
LSATAQQNPVSSGLQVMRVDPLSWWKSEIGAVAPVGFALRTYLFSRWVRVHSLPDSKRYPDCEAEYTELLARHAQIADTLFTEAEPLFLFRSRLDETDEPRMAGGVPLSNISLTLAVNPRTVAPEDDEHLIVRAATIQWKPAFFEAFVRGVADDVEDFVVFVSPATRNIYAPYDGGMDIFTFTVSPELIKAQFAAWKSSRADHL